MSSLLIPMILSSFACCSPISFSSSLRSCDCSSSFLCWARSSPSCSESFSSWALSFAPCSSIVSLSFSSSSDWIMSSRSFPASSFCFSSYWTLDRSIVKAIMSTKHNSSPAIISEYESQYVISSSFLCALCHLINIYRSIALISLIVQFTQVIDSVCNLLKSIIHVLICLG